MNIHQYLQNRENRLKNEFQPRDFCRNCRQPGFSCYCESLKVFDPGVKFIILNHPIEMKRRIATGRMAHLCLKNSELIVGHDYTHNQRVNELIHDPKFYPVILYPGPSSMNLTGIDSDSRKELFPQDKILTIFVIDGTWATAKQTAFRSLNLKKLPRICFTPPAPSTFRVRKQPSDFCYSTIEAIHHTLNLLDPTKQSSHNVLIQIFDKMVERQLQIKANRSLVRKGREASTEAC